MTEGYQIVPEYFDAGQKRRMQEQKGTAILLFEIDTVDDGVGGTMQAIALRAICVSTKTVPANLRAEIFKETLARRDGDIKKTYVKETVLLNHLFAHKDLTELKPHV